MFSMRRYHFRLPDHLQSTANELNTFSGGPLDKFSTVGSESFRALLDLGLQPSHVVLDIGCGALRIGYWLISFLDSGNYYGIEPNKQMLNEGLTAFFDRDKLAFKQPRFSNSDNFDFSFLRNGNKNCYDVALARSIFTHASLRQIECCFSHLRAVSHPGSILLASYLPAKFVRQEHLGDKWVGKSHESNEPGIIKYRFSTLKEIANKFGFSAYNRPSFLKKVLSQEWLLFVFDESRALNT